SRRAAAGGVEHLGRADQIERLDAVERDQRDVSHGGTVAPRQCGGNDIHRTDPANLTKSSRSPSRHRTPNRDLSGWLSSPLLKWQLSQPDNTELIDYPPVFAERRPLQQVGLKNKVPARFAGSPPPGPPGRPPRGAWPVTVPV